MKQFFYTKGQSDSRYANAVPGTDKAKDADKLDGKDSTELGLNWKGTWNPATIYGVRDAVEFGGSSYVALAASTAEQPGTGASWTLLAAQGATGATGASGPQGPEGPPGPPAGPPLQPYSAPNMGFLLNIEGEGTVRLRSVRGCFQTFLGSRETEETVEDCRFAFAGVPDEALDWLRSAAEGHASQVRDVTLCALDTGEGTVLHRFLIVDAFIAEAVVAGLDSSLGTTDAANLDFVVVPGPVTEDSGACGTPGTLNPEVTGFRLAIDQIDDAGNDGFVEVEGMGINVARVAKSERGTGFTPGATSVNAFGVGIRHGSAGADTRLDLAAWIRNFGGDKAPELLDATLVLKAFDGTTVASFVIADLKPLTMLEPLPTAGVHSVMLSASGLTVSP